ncbi:Uncharacterised protein [Vibrio cholerae]|uniref:Uncharacterized protein n=1 Tax=Vibrio cholerae TaxID=666 RepID=A0A655RGU4_VIBCL|nr:Uncharacterised protein [Vibrio cholerae]CSA57005.1 Uncharacterised protein [Vibrio cholerae]CSA84446.1 Uncharacterised protein [Vibrio cholerae]CSA86743.1 Uncharacterised protein [Vibrio cholerae]CSA87911.1 Uncharacterised protein [Vibrio cholerae]
MYHFESQPDLNDAPYQTGGQGRSQRLRQKGHQTGSQKKRQEFCQKYALCALNL